MNSGMKTIKIIYSEEDREKNIYIFLSEESFKSWDIIAKHPTHGSVES